ncbi:MAG: AbrB/MazE/SpoVT family DNA-binding domain-containing protein [Candidatus Anammoxibacter sp.]
MAHLVKIGNSQGIKIPKNLITKARFEGKELNIQVFKGGLYLSSNKRPREGWKEAIDASIASHGKEPLNNDWLDASFTSGEEWDW